MDDYYDDGEDYNSSQREEKLQKNLYAMQDMLRQLNEAKNAMEEPQHSPYYPRGQGSPQGGPWGNPQGGPWGSPQGGPWGGPQGGPRRGPRGGYQDRRGGRGNGNIPPLLENYRPYRGSGRGRGQNYRGRGQPSSQYRHEYGSSRGNSDNQSSPRRSSEAYGIRPQFLVETLADYPGFSCSLLQLLEQRNMQPRSIRDIAFKFPNILCVKDEVVELKPQIRICPAHCGSQGCQNPNTCNELHICDKYIMDWCRDKNCIFGHRWRTGHNDPILRSLLIDRLPFPTLRKLLQLTENDSSGASGPLDICNEYNGEGCNQRTCTSLHICLSFVTELTRCKISDCQLNHDLLSLSCRQLLEKHSIPTNESPRDVLLSLLASNPSLNSGEDKHKSSKEQKSKGSSKHDKKEKVSVDKTIDSEKVLVDKTIESDHSKSKPRKSTKKKGKTKNTKTESSDDSDSETSSDTENKSHCDTPQDGVKGTRKKDKNTKISSENVKPLKVTESSKENSIPNKPETRRTLWSHYLQGDVPVPEICYYAVESSCKDEGSGCKRLHATKHFHWQVSEQGSRWLNLRPKQVDCIEYAYCEPSKDGTDLPRLDPANLEYSVSGLFIIMGRDVWHSDFKTMVLTNASKTKTLHIRRLCTETIDGQKIKPSTFVWYFLDKNYKWVQYGNVDTAGASHLVSNITSDEIEKQFMQNPASSVYFKNSKFTYVLDCTSMTQMNLNTRVARKVIRRPMPHLQDEKKEEDKKKASTDLPDAWEKMQPEERVRLVSLAPTSSEYKIVVGLLSGNISGTNVMKVQRIQNPYLWRALQNKIKEMTAIYRDASKVNVRQLFHGTGHTIVSNICAENFDWRLHGSKSGQSFGRGTYFATDPNYSYHYASPDSNNMRYMFIARVAVGVTTRGDSSMVRPPTNPTTNAPFDSTVNSVSNPTIIVKYDKQEYYPEYLLTLA